MQHGVLSKYLVPVEWGLLVLDKPGLLDIDLYELQRLCYRLITSPSLTVRSNEPVPNRTKINYVLLDR